MNQSEHSKSELTGETSSETIIKLELESSKDFTLNSFSSETIDIPRIFTNNLPSVSTNGLGPENVSVTENISNIRKNNEIYLQDIKIKEEILDDNNIDKINELNTVEDKLKMECDKQKNAFNRNISSIKSENEIVYNNNKIHFSIEFTPDKNKVIDNLNAKCDDNEKSDEKSNERELKQSQTSQMLFNDDIYNCTLKALLSTNRSLTTKKMLAFPTCDYTAKVGAFINHSKPMVSQIASNSAVIRKQTPFDSEKPYECLQCDFRTKRKQHLEDHMRIHTGEKPFRCNSCDYKCSKKSSLIRHEKIHSGRTPFKCKFCDFKSCVKQSIIRHNRQHVGEKVFACSYCNHKCLRLSFLVRHERVHTGEKPFACPFCDYRSNNKSNLITHFRKHTGEKPYACTYCDYRSSDKSHLITHCRQHTGEKPYACDYCDYRSCNKANLVIHHRQHTGEKPFACDYCKYKSSTKANLVTHIRIHTGEKPYACQHCDYKCSNRANLITHSHHHKEVIKET